ncbi:MAG: glucuronate isomerase [Clostridiales bacterium]|nr:glucuronate isomerase [Clostridiales bacterium]
MRLINDNFLLENNTALKLYNEYAKDLPIVDYHCHIESSEIAQDKNFKNITELWLGGDHYKWRLMRSAGIDERFITGDASDKEKFMMWAKAVESAFGNPLYHWTCLELARYFDIDEPLTTLNAESVWEKTNAMLDSGTLSARSIMGKSNVELICTTDDPCDSLIYHEQIKDSGFETAVLPAFRPDNIVDIEKDSFCSYVGKLESASGMKIASVEDLKKALISRLDHFEAHGCRLSDHGTEYIRFSEDPDVASEDVFAKKMASPDAKLSAAELAAYKTDLMLFFAREYAKRGWTMQLHFGCKRNVNSVMLKNVGINCGCDIITGSFDFVTPLTGYMDKLNNEGLLPKMIIYSLNPVDNTAIDTLCGAYNDGTVPGKISHGAAWWFNDNLLGMEDHLKSLCAQSPLPCFMGMLTDSRCFLSYTRHEYFRRIFCNYLGTEVERGRFPADMRILKDIVYRVCYKNARDMLVQR